MEIIFGRENAENLRQRYTVLDLETVIAENGQPLEVFCLIPADKLNLQDLPKLSEWVNLHNLMLTYYHTKENDKCLATIKELMGAFNGEVDSFYDEIARRLEEVNESV